MIHVLPVVLACQLVSAGLIVLLRPLLVRYALARPNARSSHNVPTPQGGGIAVLAAMLLVLPVGLALLPASGHIPELLVVAAAALTLAAVGCIDDIRPLPALLRLVLQAACVSAVVLAAEDRVLPEPVPLALERAALIFAGIWFVNVVNFMDGIDLITVAEVVPIAAFFALMGATGLIPLWIGLVGAALLGAILGFAPFNRPVARLFLGDVGSLPLGLLIGWMLLELAGRGALAAAILLPLYYLADATLTLLRRLGRGERVWEAHRQHFYQQALDRNGFSVIAVVAHVFALNLALAGLALVTILWPGWGVGAVAVGGLLVVIVIRRFAAPRAVRVAA